MGGPEKNMNSLALFAIIASLGSALAAPTSDELVELVVPETSAVPDLMHAIKSFQHATKDPREAALQAFKFVQQAGADTTACTQVANSMIQAVQDETNQANENLNTVDLGANCPSTFQDAVDLAHSNDATAQTAADDAQTAFAQVALAQVTMTVRYDPDETECAVPTSNSNWQAAKTAYDAAKSTRDSTAAVANETAAALNQANALQVTEIHNCHCTAQAALATSIQTNTANNAQNAADWNQAHQLLCVLANQTVCNVPPVPVVQVPTAPPAVADANCAGATPAPTQAGPPNYLVKEDTACPGRNELLNVASGYTYAQCQAACDANSQCVSFERDINSGGFCHLSTSCTQNEIESHNNYITYLKSAPGGVYYTPHENRACSGRNDILQASGYTHAECKAACDANPNCVSMERKLGTSKCQLSSTCTTAYDQKSNKWILFVKQKSVMAL